MKKSSPLVDALRSHRAARGLRITPQRRIILEAIAQAGDHPDIEELHQRVAGRAPKISLSTVYRTVRLLEDLNIIERHVFRDARPRFEPASPRHHDHLIDSDTGQVIEFRDEEIEQLQQKIARRLGYTLIGHRLELYGVKAKSGSVTKAR